MEQEDYVDPVDSFRNRDSIARRDAFARGATFTSSLITPVYRGPHGKIMSGLGQYETAYTLSNIILVVAYNQRIRPTTSLISLILLKTSRLSLNLLKIRV